MFYAVRVLYQYNNVDYGAVWLVYAEDARGALKKAMVLAEPFGVRSIELIGLSNEHLDRIKVAGGGAFLCRFELLTD